MKGIPLELQENWSEDSRGILSGTAVWSDLRNIEPIGILQNFSPEDTQRILQLPQIMAMLVACVVALREDLKEGTLSASAQLLPELEKKVSQLGVQLPNVDNS